jgi:hypothetical protein
LVGEREFFSPASSVINIEVAPPPPWFLLFLGILCMRKMGVEKEGLKSGGGYVGSFFQLFDWTAKSRKKLFSSKSDLPGIIVFHVTRIFNVKYLSSCSDCNLVYMIGIFHVSFFVIWCRAFQTRKEKRREHAKDTTPFGGNIATHCFCIEDPIT